MDDQRMDAIIAANAGMFSSPSYSEKGAREKVRNWKKFVDSLTWEKVIKAKKKPTVGEIRRSFGSLGVMVKNKDKKGDKVGSESS